MRQAKLYLAAIVLTCLGCGDDSVRHLAALTAPAIGCAPASISIEVLERRPLVWRANGCGASYICTRSGTYMFAYTPWASCKQSDHGGPK